MLKELGFIKKANPKLQAELKILKHVKGMVGGGNVLNKAITQRSTKIYQTNIGKMNPAQKDEALRNLFT